MTDWERVEKLRSQGLSWDEIAADERVGFSAPGASGRPGLALKALYFQRRSRSRRGRKGSESSSGEVRPEVSEGPLSQPSRSRTRRLARLAFLGLLLAVAGAIPYLVGLAYPVLTALLPGLYLALAVVIGGVLVALSFVVGGTRTLEAWRRPVALGVVVGVLLAGALFGVTSVAGCPNLSASTSSEPGETTSGDWEKASNPEWESNGAPVFFFYGSTACPYCSASSWALRDALEAFGTLSGWTYGNSDPTDSYGDGATGIPEVRLDTASLASPYLSWDVHEATGPHVSVPAVGCPESAYVSAYDSQGSIPFTVVGGQFVHVATFVDPGCLTTGGCGCTPAAGSPDSACGTDLTYEQVQTDLTDGTGGDSTEINAATCALEAYFLYADKEAGISGPPAVASDSCVIGIYDGIH